MLNLSVRYDVLKSPVTIGSKIKEPGEASMYLMAGMLPENVGNLCANTNSFRDALVYQVIMAGDPMTALSTLVNRLNNLQIVDNKEDVGICEAVATLAFVLGDMELTKETIIRIPPFLATDYIATVYQAFARYSWDSERFKGLILNTGKSALESWDAEKVMVTI